jgi:hypothetical protein
MAIVLISGQLIYSFRMINKKSRSCAYFSAVLYGILLTNTCFSQDTTRIPTYPTDSLKISQDSILRIRNLNPYFTLHVDSTLNYQLEINKNPSHYFWFLKNSPVGLKINKDNGLLTFKAEKSYFLSGKLKYDNEYKVTIGVQNLNDPKERVDTSFTLLFFTTDIIPSRVKPSVSGTLYIEEGDTLSFKVECEAGSFPIEEITFFSNIPLKNYTLVKKCDDEFTWSPNYDFVRETDSAKQKLLILSFVGTTKFFNRDTAIVKIYVKDALNYPVALADYDKVVKSMSVYILQLKYAFVQLDKKVKKTKNTRSSFDLTTATSALGGTIFSSAASTGAQNAGKILPGAGIALVPVKETVAPPLTAEQNSASLVRSSIKRMDYIIRENALVGEKDMDITKKTGKLKDELKQTQIQLIDIPIELTNTMTEEELNAYFNSPKVNKKYKLKNK